MKSTTAKAMIAGVVGRFWVKMYQRQVEMLHFEVGIVGRGYSWQSFSPKYSQSLAVLTGKQENVMHRGPPLPDSNK
jgi:hypothetical protein